jgi:ubiquinone/menaquinone biosynthesis C-methylase UbiE
LTDKFKLMKELNPPSYIVHVGKKEVKCYDDMGTNIDPKTVHSFGEEWKAFNKFQHEELIKFGAQYFDIVTDDMCGMDKIAADFGCGTGRWTKYISDKFGSIAAIDPSDSIFTAANLLQETGNAFLYKASIDNLPFKDNYFDFGFSLGVLHHIPDTQSAMEKCVSKIKPGGHFLVYLYYSFENRSLMFKALYWLSNLVRLVVSKLPARIKKFVCNILAVVLYMPFVLICRFLRWIRVPEKFRKKIPLQNYEKASFYIIRNDSLDRFGTPLEKRFSRRQIEEMMKRSGLDNIFISNKPHYWHAIGEKISP